jgi:hypothetical protein
MAVIKKINLNSRGEIVAQLIDRQKNGLVKDCRRLRLEHHAAGYEPKCEINWASEEKDPKVDAKMQSAYGQGYQIDWPMCPTDCQHYDKVDNFAKSAGRDQYDQDEEHPPPKPAPVPVPPPRYVKTVPVPPTNAEKGTAQWLWANLPWNIWVSLVALLSFAFVVGIQMTRLPIVREIFGLSGGGDARAMPPPEIHQPASALQNSQTSPAAAKPPEVKADAAKPYKDLLSSPPATKAVEPKIDQTQRKQ